MKYVVKEIMSGMPENAKLEIIEIIWASDFFVKYGNDKIICTITRCRRNFVGFYIIELLHNGKPYPIFDFLENIYRRVLGSFMVNVNDMRGGNALFEEGVVYVVKICF